MVIKLHKRIKIKFFLLVSIVMISAASFTGCAGKETEKESEPVITEESGIPEQEVEFEE